ncbi:iron(III) transport system substrate-binding protein [Luteococcus japonicus]|uniref:Iron(III) transport system substrate-binding protein n=1 Tax=Luteococcus japonicus TaxID=33984 RepID=A0A3N1ZWL8_9ACTN|nr:extracellular solute-binding protein [Luteococcus japonicus]ROR55251.1 iron(III) transport system substrate-binding protein [Luteococcus japonicus]
MTAGVRRGWTRNALAAWLALVTVSVLMVGATPGTGPRLAVVCSSIEDICQQWAHDFTEATGVSVDMVRMSSGQALAAVQRSDGEFDVWHGGTSDLYEVARSRGLLMPHASSAAATIPSRYKASDGSWIGVYRGMLGFCSNQRVLRRLGVSPPEGWEDLLDPRLRGQVTLPDPRTSGTGYTMLWTIVQRTGGLEEAMEWFERLRPNVLQFTSSGMAPSGIAARGEAAVAVTFTQHCVNAHDQGLDDLIVGYPRGVTGAETGAVAVLAAARHSDLARRYVDHAVGQQAQEAGGQTSPRQLPTLPGAYTDPRLELPAGTRELEASGDQAARRRAGLVAEFVRRVGP